MLKRFFKISTLLLAVGIFVYLVNNLALVSASNLIGVSDKVDRPWPGAASMHELNFTIVNSIPSGGRIIITPASNSFMIPAGFLATDVRLQITNTSGDYLEHTLNDGMDTAVVVTGNNGKITFRLAEEAPANSKVRVFLGTFMGANNITNPGITGSVKIKIETTNSPGVLQDTGLAGVTIQNPIITNLKKVSDRIEKPWPSSSTSSVPSAHVLNFTLSKPLLGGGRIVITPNPGQFNIPADFDYRDVDLAIMDGTGSYVDLSLNDLPNISQQSVSTVAGFNGQVEIILNSTTNIAAGQTVMVRLGNASYGEPSDSKIFNPIKLGPHVIKVETKDVYGDLLDRANAVVNIINPVGVNVVNPRVMYELTPTGELFNVLLITLQFRSNFAASCRYSDVSGTSFDSMTEDFNYSLDSRGHFYQAKNDIIGLPTSVWHSFYILCKDTNGVVDTKETIIKFFIFGGGTGGTGGGTGSGTGAGTGAGSGTTGNSTSTGSGGGGTGGGSGAGVGTGASSGGGGGGGGGGGAGGAGSVPSKPFPDLPANPDLLLAGYAYPQALVTLLKDGVKFKEVAADSQGKFSFAENNLPEAVYSFGFWARDSENRISKAFNTIFAIKEAVKTSLTSIITTPTIDADKKTVAVGELLVARGQSAPNATIEIILEPNKAGVVDKDRLKQSVVVGANGKWSINLDTKNLVQGAYNLKARTVINLVGYSDYSLLIGIGVGQAANSNGTCSGPDLNRDGKVNLIDFSILLYNWGTNNNPCADLNKNGKVDLPDFSIMLYNWTG